MNNIKILDVQWFTRTMSIGIVTIDNGFEIKTYLKPVLGFNKEHDIRDIIENGIKIYPSQLERILSFYKDNEEQNESV
jgi:hypothetical protein